MKQYPSFELKAVNISKSYDGFTSVFSPIGLSLKNGEILGIIGCN